jgi:hypothetical protein
MSEITAHDASFTTGGPAADGMSLYNGGGQ